MPKTLFDLVHNAPSDQDLGRALQRDCLSDILLVRKEIHLARSFIAQGSHVVVALDEYGRNAV